MRPASPPADPYRAIRRLAALTVAALLLFSFAAPRAENEPLTDEDVVLMFVSGEPTERIIDKIRASDVAFDVSDEMMEELRLAGIPAEVLRAMADRQRETEQSAEGADGGAPVESTLPPPSLLLRLNPDWKPTDKRPRPLVRVLDLVDPGTYQQLRLRGDNPRFTDVAIALLCRTQDHVPDHWRSQTPLGRDFVNAPRHRLLSFISGAEREEPGQLSRLATKVASTMSGDDVPETALLVLEIPESVEVSLEREVVHDLTVALALQVEDRFYLVAWDTLDGLELEGHQMNLDVMISGDGNGEAGLAGLGISFSPRETSDD